MSHVFYCPLSENLLVSFTYTRTYINTYTYKHVCVCQFTPVCVHVSPSTWIMNTNFSQGIKKSISWISASSYIFLPRELSKEMHISPCSSRRLGLPHDRHWGPDFPRCGSRVLQRARPSWVRFGSDLALIKHQKKRKKERRKLYNSEAKKLV